MALTHHHDPLRGVAASGTLRRHREGGYVLALFGLLLVPLLLMAGLAVDVGYWYNRSSDIQKAADAASLAGVVWLPDIGEARARARAVAKLNGFDDADPNVSVSVTESSKAARRLKVTITVDRVGSFFYNNLGGQEIELSRTSFAEYVLPVPLGSPDNRFGNDLSQPAASRPNLWAAINGPYMNKESGDPYSTRCINPASATSCNGDGANNEYRNSGYYYAIEVPADAVDKALTVQMYDPTYTNAGSTAGDGPQIFAANAQRTGFELFEPDSTPLDHTNNPTLSGRCSTGPGKKVFTQAEAAGKDKWYTLCTITAAKEGTYVLQVKSGTIPTFTDTGTGNNAYALRATMTGGVQPKLYGIGDISIFTNSAGSIAEFYLAEVEGIHAGKTFELRLFDPGDGSSGTYDLSIINPDGGVSQCKYTNSNGVMGTVGGCTIRTRVNGASTPNVYNSKWLTIQIPLPANYNCSTATAAGCWWKVRYNFGTGSPTDRTTWAARIIGDPVHLIEEN